jgi:hypothetical protein
LFIEANAFNSMLSAGKLQFTTPSLAEIMGQSLDVFGFEDSMTFSLGLIDTNPVT